MLRAMDSTQIIEIYELPDLRPPPSVEVDERLANETAPLTTGGIEKLIERAIEN